MHTYAVMHIQHIVIYIDIHIYYTYIIILNVSLQSCIYHHVISCVYVKILIMCDSNRKVCVSKKVVPSSCTTEPFFEKVKSWMASAQVGTS